ncbi:MAG TPA: hypothetical protein PK078_04210 [Anaerolineales bacterium]|nr:hypothetical protein [Anaerolineales bacterium]HNB35660.1 hypothetical protein [Anaerolineales bacterium]
MNTILLFFIQILITLLIAGLVVGYLRPFLRKILVDLCGTEDRAQFWMAFTNTLLIGLPLVIALAYHPEAMQSEELFFDLARKLSGNIAGLLFALVCTGLVVSIFALFAPRTIKAEAK